MTQQPSSDNQEDYDSETSDSRASTPDRQQQLQQLAPAIAPSLQSSANNNNNNNRLLPASQTEPTITTPVRQSADVFPTTVTRSESLKIPSTTPNRVSSSSPLSSSPIRRSSCGDQFANRQHQLYRNHTVSYPRDTGRRYYVRERKDNEDLLANLLNLRDLLLNQNVHA